MNLDIAKPSAAAPPTDLSALRGHLTAQVSQAQLEREPFCHIYIEGIFPANSYPRDYAM